MKTLIRMRYNSQKIYRVLYKHGDKVIFFFDNPADKDEVGGNSLYMAQLDLTGESL